MSLYFNWPEDVKRRRAEELEQALTEAVFPINEE
jgi:glycerol-3-phosphate dehydrogenase